jgi:molecular chaperone GrpE
MTSTISRKLILDSLKRQLCLASTSKTLATRSAAQRQYHVLNCPSTASGMYGSNNSLFSNLRAFSDKPDGEESKEEAKEEKEEATEGNDESTAEEERPSEIEKLQAEVKEVKDQLLRSYAEQENIRRIAQKDISNSKAFAITSFAKSLLDTSDNLTRALDAVPEEYREDKENHAVLATLFEGIKMTDDGLAKAFAKNGLKKFGEVGDKFDPNMHEALFEYPDENMEAGTIGQIMKVGFSLKDRVIRPAEVGVIKST